MSVEKPDRRCKKMPKNYCINTKGLSQKERKELATDLNEFVANKKAEFQERRQESIEGENKDE